MARTETPMPELGQPAPAFSLPGVDGRTWTLEDVRGENGLLVMFICNHCPYVKAVRDKIIRDARELKRYGIGAIAISANDPTDYPEDSFERMQQVAREYDYPFPYTCTTRRRPSRGPTAPCARRTSSDTTATCGCSTAAVWMRPDAARTRRRRGSCSRR